MAVHKPIMNLDSINTTKSVEQSVARAIILAMYNTFQVGCLRGIGACADYAGIILSIIGMPHRAVMPA